MRKILVANRGEIAVRIMRACRDLGLKTVAVYSQADSAALHVSHADEAVCIGPPAPARSYLKRASILAACEITGADAVHPGYGFLSESAQFAEICASCGLRFIGPKASAIALLGDKARAKQLARRLGIPTLPDSNGPVDLQEAKRAARSLGFPLLIKAVSGGGGRGIRVVESPEGLADAWTTARAEAQISFGNPAVYLEKFLTSPRHVEVQVIADERGHRIHLGDRDCTVQRRRQKLLEEAPAPLVDEQLRAHMTRDALALLAEADYSSLGTVEFLLDGDGRYYFMEVNARAQVEHTVTEEITGIDLICEQIQIAAGEPLRLSQGEVKFTGHALQLRVNAECPERNFQPSPGTLTDFILPGGPNVRVDTASYAGSTISPHYDSLIAKLIVRGNTRNQAICIARRALSEFRIGGISSTLSFHERLLRDPEFVDLDYDLTFVDRKFAV